MQKACSATLTVLPPGVLITNHAAFGGLFEVDC
jgi:hypothetical protein